MKISVYIPSYNQKSYLVEAIESVLSQTLKPHQIILVDDCSSDGSQDVIAAYTERYPGLVTPIYHSRNCGIGQTRMDALQTVTGDFVTYVDGDDRFLPTKLEKEAQALRGDPDARIAFSNYFHIDSEGARTRLWSDGELPPAGYVFREAFLRQFPLNSLFRSELVRYDVLESVGFYDTSFDLYEDWELRMRLTKRFRTVYVDEPLSEYRRHGSSLSNAKLLEHVKAWERIWQKNRVLLNDLEPVERERMEIQFAELVEGLRTQAHKQAGRRVDDGHRQIKLHRRLRDITRRFLGLTKRASGGSRK